MCGIVGILSPQEDSRSTAITDRMLSQIVHRGPDDSGVYQSGPLTFGFRRLAIIDLSGGHQPMNSQDGRYVLVFNGEIYNFHELRAQLQQEHQRHFNTRSDTEVVLQAFEVWGTKSFVRLNGMFAIALWDDVEKKLYLARDRSGKKPIYTCAIENTLLLASEVKCFLEHPQFVNKPDLSRVLTSITYRYVPGQETLFAGVNAVRAGHWEVYTPGNTSGGNSHAYWSYPTGRREKKQSAATLVKSTREKLSQVVKRRLVSDVPLGAFLSGGIDSSLIVALMSKACGQVDTFSVGFDTGFSEHNHARIVAGKFATRHHETIVSAKDLLREIPRVLWHRETPISEPSDIPLFILSREARRHVTVVLSGEGSDELFAGYPKYSAEYYTDKWPGCLIARSVPAIQRFLPGRGASSPLAIAIASMSEADRFSRMARWFGAFNSADYPTLLTPELTEHLDAIHKFARSVEETVKGATPLTWLQIQDHAHWLPANLLLRADRVTMANSLELRCPFLDPELIDFALRDLPDSLKIRHGISKWIIREIAKDLLPSEIIRRRKWGFKVPVGEWFRGALKPVLYAVLLSPAASARSYFNMGEINRLIREHTHNGADNSKQLWFLLQLELWHLMFVDGTLQPSDDLLHVQ